MRRSVLFIAAALCFLPIAESFAQERTDSLCLTAYFKRKASTLDLKYRNNAASIEAFTSGVKKVMADPQYRILSIDIRSSASPEGVFHENLLLSWRRGTTLRATLQSRLNIPEEMFTIDAVGEDWITLREMVKKNNYPAKEQILKILDDHKSFVEGRPQSYVGSPKKELMELNGGNTWRWLLENVYPELRSAGNSVVYRYAKVDPSETEQSGRTGHIIDTVIVIHKYVPDADSVATAGACYPVYGAQQPRSKAKEKRARKEPGYRFAVKTNLLFDAIAAPNVELEFPVGKRVSLLAFHYFPWYTSKDDSYAYQVLNTGGECRFWFGDRKKRPVLTGGYLGLYGAAAKADLEYKSKGYQVPFSWHAGLTAGWSFPLGKNDNWRLDLGLAIGYFPIKYDYYEQSPNNGLLIYKYSDQLNWIGPTNVKCSIVWMLPMNKKAK